MHVCLLRRGISIAAISNARLQDDLTTSLMSDLLGHTPMHVHLNPVARKAKVSLPITVSTHPSRNALHNNHQRCGSFRPPWTDSASLIFMLHCGRAPHCLMRRAQRRSLCCWG